MLTTAYSFSENGSLDAPPSALLFARNARELARPALGLLFEGEHFEARGEITGGIVFTAGMTGYLETLTDPGQHGQIVLQTSPLIGNCGVIPSDFKSDFVEAKEPYSKASVSRPLQFP